MSVFHYPKAKYTRRIDPPQYKKYRSFKRVLQHEFFRVCVYCRHPDSATPTQHYAFAVDHYRPKALPQFAGLVCSYENLFYCCSSCNSRKSNYWPTNENVDPFIVNPCDFQMADHLRFDQHTGRIESKTPHGKFTIELLMLNDDESVKYRIGVLQTVRVFDAEIRKCEKDLTSLRKLLKGGKITQADYDAEVATSLEQIEQLRFTLHSSTGERSLRPLPRTVRVLR